jgi:hypothetical protein
MDRHMQKASLGQRRYAAQGALALLLAGNLLVHLDAAGVAPTARGPSRRGAGTTTTCW